ncbi:22066_t:CDS:2, partial [Gigaspora margarita]
THTLFQKRRIQRHDKKLLQVAFDGSKLKKEILEELEEEDDPLFFIVKQKKVDYKDKYGENMYYYKFSKRLDKFVARLIDTFFCDAQEKMYSVIRGRFKRRKNVIVWFYKKDEETRKYFKEFSDLVKNYNEDLVSSDLHKQIIEKIDKTLVSFKNKRFN